MLPPNDVLQLEAYTPRWLQGGAQSLPQGSTTMAHPTPRFGLIRLDSSQCQAISSVHVERQQHRNLTGFTSYVLKS